MFRISCINWRRTKDTIYKLTFEGDPVLIAQKYEDIEFMVRKLLEEYEKWDLKINLEKRKRLSGLWSRNQIFNIGRSEIFR